MLSTHYAPGKQRRCFHDAYSLLKAGGGVGDTFSSITQPSKETGNMLDKCYEGKYWKEFYKIQV